mgnify:CR=1 FL=1
MTQESNRRVGGNWSQGPDDEAELRVEAGAEGHELVVDQGIDHTAEEHGPRGAGGPGLPLPAGLLGGNVHYKMRKEIFGKKLC